LLPASEDGCSISPASENADVSRYCSADFSAFLLRQGGVFDFLVFPFCPFFDFFMFSFYGFRLFRHRHPYALMGGGLLVLGIGAAMAMTPATSAITEALPPAQQGVGSALNDLSREVGGATGIAVIGSILTSTYASHVNVTGLSSQVATQVRTPTPPPHAWAPRSPLAPTPRSSPQCTSRCSPAPQPRSWQPSLPSSCSPDATSKHPRTPAQTPTPPQAHRRQLCKHVASLRSRTRQTTTGETPTPSGEPTSRMLVKPSPKLDPTPRPKRDQLALVVNATEKSSTTKRPSIERTQDHAPRPSHHPLAVGSHRAPDPWQ